MREIKFRAKKKDGQYIYGYLVNPRICYEKTKYAIESPEFDPVPVIEETIQQFCGYDSEGNEVYEGDEVIAHDKTYKVELKPHYGLFTSLKRCRLKQGGK